jgi:predicted O-methyltransferase YrrM
MAKSKLDAESLNKLHHRLEASRRSFGSLLREFEHAGGRYLDRAARLPQEMVDNCRVFADRVALLEMLPRHGIVAEVGTDRGDFAAKIISIAQPRMLHVFEIDITRINPDNLSAHVDDGTCQIHPGDASEQLRSFPDESFDWIYIDADHSYEGVKRDINVASSKIKQGGLMIFNDYAVWSVTSMSRCGVAKAVNEFIINTGWPLVGFAFQASMYCDACLQRPGGETIVLREK